jgi:hypothetical protein
MSKVKSIRPSSEKLRDSQNFKKWSENKLIPQLNLLKKFIQQGSWQSSVYVIDEMIKDLRNKDA